MRSTRRGCEEGERGEGTEGEREEEKQAGSQRSKVCSCDRRVRLAAGGGWCGEREGERRRGGRRRGRQRGRRERQELRNDRGRQSLCVARGEERHQSLQGWHRDVEPNWCCYCEMPCGVHQLELCTTSCEGVD